MVDFRTALGRLGRPLATGSVVLGLSLVGWSQVRMQQIVDKQERETDLRIATQCVASHERIEQIRTSDETAYRRQNQTLIELVEQFSDDPTDVVTAIRAAGERDVAEIRAAVDDPDCDLEAAKKLVEEE